MRDGETLVSADQGFELGFFSPGTSRSRYLGIWYKKVAPKTTAWVANRDTPISTDNKEDVDVHLFDLSTIATATNNFSRENLIGAGGFGPVYKGTLSTGEEVAVKRLSNNSGQGAEEFRNEVNLIAKLQHRNLVGLLGSCIQGEERLLIYEYMPNKSLDYFVFDQKKAGLLTWQRRFDIVMGIARGLLGDDKEAKTNRVIGTYGYMSPEYTIDGTFSVKSDVFSFGVFLLEIISGKKNRGFSHPAHHHNLLGHAWLLWNEMRALELMDSYEELKPKFKNREEAESEEKICYQVFDESSRRETKKFFVFDDQAAVQTTRPVCGYDLLYT
ncbi:hypothetical protein QYF36_020558 [Acer negundo]|nr:hypothetical protein QYF36_020558 [Acer negundo]